MSQTDIGQIKDLGCVRSFVSVVLNKVYFWEKWRGNIAETKSSHRSSFLTFGYEAKH